MAVFFVGVCASAALAQDAAPEPADQAQPADQPAELEEKAEARAAQQEPDQQFERFARDVAQRSAEAKEAVAADPLLARPYRKAMVIELNGAIFDGMKAYVLNRLKAAERGKCDLIVLRITSPGGELEASEELAEALSEIDWATTIAYVPEEAYSGAAIVALGCDRILMNPRALIGDAGPIQFLDGLFEHADQKIVSALAAWIHQMAVSKKRPGAVAEAMVDRKLVVYEARNKKTGARTYLTASDIELPEIKQEYTIGPAIPESGQDRFLTVSGTRAVELMIAEGTFESQSNLLTAMKIDQIVSTQRTWVDQAVYILNRPFVSGLLLLVGLIGLYVEFSVPGISVAGLISLLCFGLFFWSHALGGTSGWLEVMMFALGLSCLCVELFVLPGFGAFGVTGLILIVLSLVMASQDFILPQSTVQWNTLRNNLLIVLGAVFCLVIALIAQVAFLDSLPGLGRFRLEAPDVEPAPIGDSVGSLVAGSSANWYVPAVGDLGVADSVLRPAGKVRFADHLVDVVTEGDFLDPGTRVEVIKREGNHVIVRRIG
ncbi:MAG: NfeD family protein [Aureliella sp.]